MPPRRSVDDTTLATAAKLGTVTAIVRRSPACAFTTFEKARRPRVDAIFKAAQRQSNNKAPTKMQAWFRDRLLPVFVKLGERGQNATYAHRINFDDSLAQR